MWPPLLADVWKNEVPPPLSFPTPCRSRGGGGGHLVNQKFFVAAHCVVVWVTVLWGTATCIPCTHGRTFCSLSLKWNLIAQPFSPPGTSVMFIRSPGEPVFAQVVGHSEHGDAYRRITYERDGKTVLHDRAPVRRLSLPRAPSPPRVYGDGAVPQGVVGDRLPWVGNDKGGGGVVELLFFEWNENEDARLTWVKQNGTAKI